MPRLRKWKRIRVDDSTVDAFKSFEIVSYGDLEIIVRRKSDHSDAITYWLIDDEAYDELLSFLMEILPKARPDSMW